MVVKRLTAVLCVVYPFVMFFWGLQAGRQVRGRDGTDDGGVDERWEHVDKGAYIPGWQCGLCS